MRKTSDEIKQLLIDQNADRLWSWSKVNIYTLDPYSYLLSYIEHIPADKNSSAYSFFGGIVHDMLEQYYKNEMTREQMIEQFENQTTIQELGNIRFDGNDDRNENIGIKYKTCVKHFLYNYQKDEEETKLEQFIHGFIGKHLFQGYIDKMHVKDNILYIDDFKTSTMYTGKKVDNEKGQLLLYTIIINQRFGIPFERIRARWNFLKYVSIDYEQINGKQVVTHSLRHEIGGSLEAKLKTWLKKCKYSEKEIEYYIEEVKRKNVEEFKDFDCLEGLPPEVKEKFHIRDCIVEIPINKSEILDFIQMISDKCDQIIAKEALYKQSGDDKLFWSEINQSNSFYFNNLCDYSAKIHKPLKEYYELWESGKSTSSAPTTNDLINDFIFG